jgi:hypothetical protein
MQSVTTNSKTKINAINKLILKFVFLLKTNNKAEKRFQKNHCPKKKREHYNLLQRESKLQKIHIPILYSVNKLYISSTFLFSVIKEKVSLANNNQSIQWFWTAPSLLLKHFQAYLHFFRYHFSCNLISF